MKDLSQKQRQILNYMERYHKDHGFPPTLRDICKTFEIKSTNGARYHLHRLRELGYVEIDEGKSRGIRLTRPDEPAREHQHDAVEDYSGMPNVIPFPGGNNNRSYTLPVLGRIPAGPFNLASEDLREDEMTVDREFFAGRVENPELFGLRVQGDSMIEAGIHEGDVVVVRSQNQANDGDIVVARLEEEATVKRFFKRMNEVVLEPANRLYEPIRISNQGGSDYGQDFALMGVVVGLIRSM